MASQPEIYYVLNSRWPTIKAYGIQVAKTCQGLNQAGAKVRLVVPWRARHREIAGIDPFVLYGIRDRFRLIWLPSLDFTRFHMNSKALFFFQQGLFAFMATVRLFFSDGVVYTRDPFTAYVMSFVRRDVFWEAHRLPEKTDSRLYQRLLHHLSGIVVITRGLKDMFIAKGVPTHRLAVIHDAVDPDEFAVSLTPQEARATLKLPLQGTMIGYVGQLSTMNEDKGVGTLIAAMGEVIKQSPGSILVIVGGNEHEIGQHRKIAQELGMGDETIRFAGHVPHMEIPLWLRAMDIAVMPFPDTPHYAHSMSPLKLFEYLAAGKPIVATDLPSVREVVNDNDVIFVRPGDAGALARGILLVVNDSATALRKHERSLKLAQQHSWKSRGEHIVSFIMHRITHRA